MLFLLFFLGAAHASPSVEVHLTSSSIGFTPGSPHPAASLALRRSLRDVGPLQLEADVELGGFWHRYLQTGLHGEGGLRLNYEAPVASLGLRLGLGEQTLLRQGGTTDSNGEPVRRPRVMARLSAGVHASVERDWGSVGLRYQLALWAPFAPGNGVPAIGQTQVGAFLAIPLGEAP